MCIQSISCNKPHNNSNDGLPSDLQCCFSFRNMNWANWRNSCIGARPKSLCTKWTPIIMLSNCIKPFITFDKKFNSVYESAISNPLLFRVQTQTYLCWKKAEASNRTKRSNSFICSRKVMKIVLLRNKSNLTRLNMGYELDLLQPKQEVIGTWHTADLRRIMPGKFHLK